MADQLTPFPYLNGVVAAIVTAERGEATGFDSDVEVVMLDGLNTPQVFYPFAAGSASPVWTIKPTFTEDHVGVSIILKMKEDVLTVQLSVLITDEDNPAYKVSGHYFFKGDLPKGEMLSLNFGQGRVVNILNNPGA